MNSSNELRAMMDALTPEQRRGILALFGIASPRVKYADLDEATQQFITLAQDEIEQEVMGDRAAPTAAEEATP